MNALEKACKFILDTVETCPNDLFEWERPEGCANVCPDDKNEISKCWVLYFQPSKPECKGCYFHDYEADECLLTECQKDADVEETDVQPLEP